MRKTMTAATTCLALICVLPQPGICFDPNAAVKELLENAENTDANTFLDRLAKLEQEISTSENIVSDGRAFIQALVNEINVRTGSSYTVRDFCNIVRQNVEAFPLSQEQKVEFLETLNLLENENRHIEAEWSFFKKHKKKDKKKDKKNQAECELPKSVWGFLFLCATGITACILDPSAAAEVIHTLGNAASVLFGKK